MLKHSKQREAIRLAIQGRSDHPTADTVYQEVRESFPHISLGTVYRNLSLLCEIGEAQKVVTGDGRERFDWNVRPHDHFRCTNCGRVMDMPGEAPGDGQAAESFKDGAASQKEAFALHYPGFEGRIDTQSTLYTGLCADCLSKETMS